MSIVASSRHSYGYCVCCTNMCEIQCKSRAATLGGRTENHEIPTGYSWVWYHLQERTEFVFKNEQLGDLTNTAHDRTKHIEIKYHLVREQIQPNRYMVMRFGNI